MNNKIKNCAIRFDDNTICPACYKHTIELINSFGSPVSHKYRDNLDSYLYALEYFHCFSCNRNFPIQWNKENQDRYKPFPLIDESEKDRLLNEYKDIK